MYLPLKHYIVFTNINTNTNTNTNTNISNGYLSCSRNMEIGIWL